MTRALVVGAGPTGHKHVAAAREAGQQVRLADPHQPLGADARELETVLEQLRPHVVTIATPPAPALGLARLAAQSRAVVVLEKPGVLTPEQLGKHAGDERIYLAHEVRFTPAIMRLLHDPPSVSAARLTLRCWRTQYPGWRQHHHSGGGLLHQQAHQALGLLAQLSEPPSWCQTWSGPPSSGTVARGIAAELGGTGTEISIDARSDAHEYAGGPHQRLRLRLHHAEGSRVLTLGGPLLECGLDDAPAAYGVYQHQLRIALHTAVARVADGGIEHPGLLPLPASHPIAALTQQIHSNAPAPQPPRAEARTTPPAVAAHRVRARDEHVQPVARALCR